MKTPTKPTLKSREGKSREGKSREGKSREGRSREQRLQALIGLSKTGVRKPRAA